MNYASSAAALVWLPAWCDWHWGKTERGKSPEYFKILQKNTIFNEHHVYRTQHRQFCN